LVQDAVKRSAPPLTLYNIGASMAAQHKQAGARPYLGACTEDGELRVSMDGSLPAAVNHNGLLAAHAQLLCCQLEEGHTTH
jgi:hypothetical protein